MAMPRIGTVLSSTRRATGSSAVAATCRGVSSRSHRPARDLDMLTDVGSHGQTPVAIPTTSSISGRPLNRCHTTWNGWSLWSTAPNQPVVSQRSVRGIGSLGESVTRVRRSAPGSPIPNRGPVGPNTRTSAAAGASGAHMRTTARSPPTTDSHSRMIILDPVRVISAAVRASAR